MDLPGRGFGAIEPSKTDQARLKLLYAAVEHFGDRGLEGATLRDIAKTAGQNVAAIAYYFGDKRGLYRAVLEALVRELHSQMGDYLEKVRLMREQSAPSRPAAAGLLREMLVAMYTRMLSRNETVPFVRLIAREQLRPSADFKILYEQGFLRMHGAFAFLTATALGLKPEDQETILRTHTFIGQVFFFAFSRGAILKRLGWKDFEGANTQTVTAVIAEQLDLLLAELSRRPK